MRELLERFVRWGIEDDGFKKLGDCKLIDGLEKVEIVLKKGGDVFGLWL